MKSGTHILLLMVVLSVLHGSDLMAQASRKTTPIPCIDCMQDSLTYLLHKAITPQDTLEYLTAYLDNPPFPEDFSSIIDALKQLLELNARLNLYDDTPYKLFLSGLILWEKGSYLESIEKQKEAITAFDNYQRIQGLSGMLSEIRIFYNYLSLQDERLAYYQEKLKYYQQHGPIENTASCYHGIAGYYLYRADYNTAISYYLKAGEVFKTFTKDGFANESVVVGMMYYRWGNFTKANEYLQSGYELSLKSGNFSNAQLANLLLGMVAKKRKDYTGALARIENCISSLSLPVDIDLWTIALAEKGGILLELNKLPEAFTAITRAISVRDSAALPIVTTTGDFDGPFYLYKYYNAIRDQKGAEKNLILGYTRSMQAKSNWMILKYTKELAHFYATLEKPDLALPYSLRYIELSDSLHDAQNKFNVSEYEKRQEELANEKEVFNLEQQKKVERNYFAGGGLFLLLLSGGIYTRLRYIRRVKKELEGKNIQIEKEKHRAEQSERFKQEFLANMSHEIRTPMNAVMGMTSLLLDKNPRHDQSAYLNGIQKSSDTLLHIINDILDLSKIEAGKIELEEIDFSIREEVKQVKHLLDHKAEEKGLHLILDIKHDVPKVVVGDPVRLNQVLLNLAGNAIKFTEKGSVTIEIVSHEPSGVSHESSIGDIQSPSGDLGVKAEIVNVESEWIMQESTTVTFKITDTGIGIPGDKLHTVFESFSQAHSSDTRKFGGTGLGLSISKQLVDLMGGRLVVESEEGSGSTFSFTIGYSIGTIEKLKATKIHEQMDGGMLDGLKILVVDDNEFNRTVARDTLRSKADVEITEAMNGKEAVELLEENEFDVILMDVQMPVMDGYEATQYIRHKLASPKNKIPIIALTASVVRSDLDKCKAAGMDDYIAKPFRSYQLLQAIAKATGREIIMTPSNVQNLQRMDNDPAGDTVINLQKITDLTYLENFCEGDKPRMKKYIRMYLDTAPVLIQKITDLLEQANYAEIASQIHAYKTKWIMMGMNDARDLALSVEQQCKHDTPPPEVKENVERLLFYVRKAAGELDTSLIQFN